MDAALRSVEEARASRNEREEAQARMTLAVELECSGGLSSSSAVVSDVGSDATSARCFGAMISQLAQAVDLAVQAGDLSMELHYRNKLAGCYHRARKFQKGAPEAKRMIQLLLHCEHSVG